MVSLNHGRGFSAATRCSPMPLTLHVVLGHMTRQLPDRSALVIMRPAAPTASFAAVRDDMVVVAFDGGENGHETPRYRSHASYRP